MALTAWLSLIGWNEVAFLLVGWRVAGARRSLRALAREAFDLERPPAPLPSNNYQYNVFREKHE